MLKPPVARHILDDLSAEGIAMHQITEEILWAQFHGLQLNTFEGRRDYMTISRVGRNFTLNRRTRHMICDYAERVMDVTVTNCEVAREKLGYGA